jgi:hypothetical protein
MIPALLAIGCLCLLGFPVAFCVAPRREAGMLLGLSFLFGAGLATLVLFFLSLARIPWTRGSFAAAAVLPLAALISPVLHRWRRGDFAAGPPRMRRFSPAAAPFDALTLIAVVGHGIYATLAPLAQWDFWADWGLKAKVFWIHRGLDWSFLQSAENRFAHPDYPPLLPLTLDFFSLVRGAWEDRYIGLLFTAFAAALLLVARDLLREELGSGVLASLGVLALTGPALTIWIGLAEGPLIAYGGAALIILRQALRTGSGWTSGALLLGAAALTKNEGLALLIATVIAALAVKSGLRGLVRLLPAFAVALVWLLPLWLHGLSSELMAGSVGQRLVRRVTDPISFLTALAKIRWPQPFLWFGAIASFFLSRLSIGRERFLLVAMAIQLLFLLGIYAVSPYPLPWHVQYSSERFLAQQTFPLAFLAIACLLAELRASGSAGATAA